MGNKAAEWIYPKGFYDGKKIFQMEQLFVVAVILRIFLLQIPEHLVN